MIEWRRKNEGGRKEGTQGSGAMERIEEGYETGW